MASDSIRCESIRFNNKKTLKMLFANSKHIS